MAARQLAAAAAAPPAAGCSSAGQEAATWEHAREQDRSQQLAAAALAAQTAATVGREAGAQLGAAAALAGCYTRRVRRLAALLDSYSRQLERALASLGLCERSDGAAPSDASASELAAALQDLEQQLAAEALDSDRADPPTPEALLQLGSGAGAASVARLAAAGAPAILAALHGAVQQDSAAVSVAQHSSHTSSAATDSSAGPLGPAFVQLQQQQRERWEAAAGRAQDLERLRAEVATVRQQLAGGDGGADAAARAQLAAWQAGLRAELQSLEGARRAAEVAAAAAGERAQRLRASTAAVTKLEQQEVAVNGAIRALCVADSTVMRRWRQGTWQAQEVVESRVVAQRRPLAQLGQQLLEAQRSELAAFAAAPALAAAKHSQQEQEPAGPAATAGKRTAADAHVAVRAAAQLLDPLAHLKTDEHAAELVAAAAAELRQLKPLRQQWAELAARGGEQAAALAAAADELGAGVQALQEGCADGWLREAAAAAAEGMELVGRTRQALSEWWTTPAVTATSWVKREGRSPEEWLRLLGDQRRALRQREAFTGRDHSNHSRLRS